MNCCRGSFRDVSIIVLLINFYFTVIAIALMFFFLPCRLCQCGLEKKYDIICYFMTR